MARRSSRATVRGLMKGNSRKVPRLGKGSPPDITYNPTSKATPYSTRSATAARRIAGAGGQGSYYHHR